MEKVTIVNVEEKTARNGKNYYSIQLNDGRKGNSFNKGFKGLHGECNVLVEQKGEYLNFDLPKEEAQATPQNLKVIILQSVLSSHLANSAAVNQGSIKDVCESLYQWVIS